MSDLLETVAGGETVPQGQSSGSEKTSWARTSKLQVAAILEKGYSEEDAAVLADLGVFAATAGHLKTFQISVKDAVSLAQFPGQTRPIEGLALLLLAGGSYMQAASFALEGIDVMHAADLIVAKATNEEVVALRYARVELGLVQFCMRGAAGGEISTALRIHGPGVGFLDCLELLSLGVTEDEVELLMGTDTPLREVLEIVKKGRELYGVPPGAVSAAFQLKDESGMDLRQCLAATSSPTAAPAPPALADDPDRKERKGAKREAGSDAALGFKI